MIAVSRSSALRARSEGRASTRTLRTIYFDTADRALKGAGLTLRLRRTGGRWVQCVKMGDRLSGGVSAKREIEVFVRRDMPDIQAIADEDVRNHITQVVGDQELIAVFETDMKRTARLLRLPSGDVELALDRGEIRADDRTTPIQELEIELKSGEAAAVYEAASEIFCARRPPFSTVSKSERGYRLLSGKDPAPLAEPVKAGRVRLEHSLSTAAAMDRIVRHCLIQISANLDACLASDDPGGPHQLRVGLRRLRSAFRGFGSAGLEAGFKALDQTAKRIASEAGALRDLDVAVNEIFADAIARDPGGAALGEALATRRQAARTKLRAFLASPEIARFPLELGAFRSGGGGETGKKAKALSRPVSWAAEKVLSRAHKKVEARGRGIEGLSIEERHDLRKAVKKLRYLVDFFSQLYPEAPAAIYAKRLRKLQNRFGYLNDAAVAADLVGGWDLPDPAAALAAGRAIGWSEAMANEKWPRTIEAWELLQETPLFWRPNSVEPEAEAP